jgi:hypothetical protein
MHLRARSAHRLCYPLPALATAEPGTKNWVERTSGSRLSLAGSSAALAAVTNVTLPMLVLVVALAAASHSSVLAQEPPPSEWVVQKEPLRVFLDCPDFACDQDFFRTEISFVTHVRDRQDAQVHALLTTRETSAGGTEFTVKFIGLGDFSGSDDQLRHISNPAESQDKIRQALAKLLKRGLIRYVNRTALGEGIEIAYIPVKGQTSAALARDPWNYWTFFTTVNGFFDGEEGFSSTSINVSLSANRTTENWKINTSIQTRYSESRFDIGEVRSTQVRREYALNGLIVKSLGPHWSAGVRATGTSSTFLNQALTLRVAPAFEYSFFPYSEATRWQFTFQYSTGVTAFDYEEETIFGRTAETLLDQRVLGTLRLLQPWGSVTASVEASHYLHDFDKHRGILFSNIDLHLGKGFSLILFGNMQLVQDQTYLSRRGISEEEILLRQRQLATSFAYSGSIGLTYTFGSSSAPVVNPRFVGSSGGTSIIN